MDHSRLTKVYKRADYYSVPSQFLSKRQATVDPATSAVEVDPTREVGGNPRTVPATTETTETTA